MRLGVRKISSQDYHRDPCPTPSLSSSVADILIKQTPYHAWLAHSRLNPEYEEKTTAEQEFGSAVHALLLNSEAERIVVVSGESWRKDAMRKVRDQSRADNKIPMLPDEFDHADWLAETAREQILASDVGEAFRRGVSERTLIWQEQGIYNRIRPDRWWRKGSIILDFKTTSGSAHPDDWPYNSQGLWWGGGAIQSALYRRGAKAITGKDHRFVFLVQEVESGLVSVIEPAWTGAEEADKDVEDAISLWRDCLLTNQWPGYGPRIHGVEPPGSYAMRKEVARLIRNRPSAEAIEAARRMQAPPTPGKPKRSRRP